MIQFTQDETQPDWHGYFYSVLFFLNALVLSLLLHQYHYYRAIVGMRIRTAVIAAVYNKVYFIFHFLYRYTFANIVENPLRMVCLQALCLSNKARQTKTVGEIVNLMSVDTQRLMDLMKILHMIWSAPLQIILSLVFLYLTIGLSIFAGFAVIVLMIPLTSCLASWTKQLLVTQMVHKDSRIKLVNEVLNGIKVPVCAHEHVGDPHDA